MNIRTTSEAWYTLFVNSTLLAAVDAKLLTEILPMVPPNAAPPTASGLYVKVSR
jgi:hypothetical protein